MITKKTILTTAVLGMTILVSSQSHADRIYGTNGKDLIWGSDQDDTIFAGKGADIVLAGDGDDIVYGGNGNDVISGEDGDDRLWGQNGNDRIWSGMLYEEQKDRSGGGSGYDRCFGIDLEWEWASCEVVKVDVTGYFSYLNSIYTQYLNNYTLD